MQVELLGVRMELPANTPMLLLREQGGAERLLPIYIGTWEASAIHDAVEGNVPPRPLTHDLFVATLRALDATLNQVVITEVQNHTFFAELHLSSGSQTTVVSARPSDAIALALRWTVPIMVADELIDQVGHVPDQDDEDQAEVILDEFRDFIEHVSPDDFAE